MQSIFLIHQPENSEVWPVINYDEELFDRVKFKKQMGITDLPASLAR